MSAEIKENVFSEIQTFLKDPPVIIWGSGATVALGLPSMRALNTALREKIDGFNEADENLEVELGKTEYEALRGLLWKMK